MAVIPGTPVVNAGLKYVNGMLLSSDEVASDFILHATKGRVRDSSNTNDITAAEDMVLDTRILGVGGRDNGALVDNSLYAVYVVGSSLNPVTSTISEPAHPASLVISLDFDAPVMPRHYNMFRRIGAVRIDNDGHIVAFHQVGKGVERAMWFSEAIEVRASAAAAAWTAVPLAGFIPTEALEVKILVNLGAAANNLARLRYTGSATTAGQATMTGNSNDGATQAVLSVPTSDLASIDVISVGNVGLSLAGYVDQL